MRNLTGKRAVITGAASGIGKAIAVQLAQSGCHTFLLDIDSVALPQTVHQVRQLGVEAYGLHVDVGNKHDVDRALSHLQKKWPEVDILVNNAGVAYRGRSIEMTHDECERIFAVNLSGPIQICQRLLPVLANRPEAHVLNMCSVLGLCGFAKSAAYSATKSALIGYSEALRAEYLGGPIGVSAVCPGYVRTPLIESVPGPRGVRNKLSIPRWLCTSPEVVARKSVKAILHNRGLVVVSPLAHVLWRLKRFTPSLFELPKRWKKRRISPLGSTPQVSSYHRDRKVA